MIILKLVVVAWVLSFLGCFMVCFFERDPKFGRFNYKTSFIAAVVFVTVIPYMEVSKLFRKLRSHFTQEQSGN
ncbi:hypothetical protein HNP46_006326 [Pseudomonas nitritireducens]|uniref:Uncharacterized protein n=1 Tax=Pseudomonas nitroreducens TaxID=46680 RepID=A0A7W7P3V9_PSENT|nr:hypothetical protein [Pseudomonas nitritireducens]MBB4867413.1 hypothetical protein [Pseudomonas nitritireducens]